MLSTISACRWIDADGYVLIRRVLKWASEMPNVFCKSRYARQTLPYIWREVVRAHCTMDAVYLRTIWTPGTVVICIRL